MSPGSFTASDAATTCDWLVPDWPVPVSVRALTTTRRGGISAGPYRSLNLAAHVGDSEAAVDENRRRLMRAAALPAAPVWLDQVHGITVVDAGSTAAAATADAGFAATDNVVCAVLTADCLPVLLYDRRQQRVAAIHAGWRGLAAGVIAATIRRMDSHGEDLLAWLGPAIGPQQFEVGGEVRAQFLAHDACSEAAFQPSANAGRWYADIYQLARWRLNEVAVSSVHGGGLCTVSDPQRFYSFRRDGVTGRMATLIWMSAER
jgi:YfiH family protein